MSRCNVKNIKIICFSDNKKCIKIYSTQRKRNPAAKNDFAIFFRIE